MENSIQLHQKELCQKLWAMANALRGNMEAYEFKNYILGMIFYYYLSDRTEKYMENLLKDDNIDYPTAWADEEYKEAVIEESLRDLGFVIEPQYLFRNMVKMVENRSFDIEFLQKAINSLMESTLGNDSQSDFEGLFSDMQLDSTKLGQSVKDRSAVMAKIIAALDEINFSVEDTKIDILGNAYEYLIGQFAATAGKKAGEFYTPAGPAELLCRLACLGLTDVKSAADPTCGSGSLLLRLKNYANVRLYYGQELTSTTYNLARMNMILRGIPYRNFEIYNGDTLEHDYFGENTKFRVQVANPPYSAKWSADNKFLEDDRFSQYGKLAPKSKADFAFVQHMVYHMDEDGRAVVLLPHGVLFRGNAEETIRKYLIEKLNVLDAVIGLPANLFFGTGIPVCVLVLKKDRGSNGDNILFIDASKDFEAGKNQNILRTSDIDKIVDAYEKREDIEKFAHVANMAEIEENGFNLNIPRYVDTFEKEPEIDLDAVASEIRSLQKEIKQINTELKPYFDELGLDFPFDEEV
jgi:type I restriction enzyme M protein